MLLEFELWETCPSIPQRILIDPKAVASIIESEDWRPGTGKHISEKFAAITLHGNDCHKPLRVYDPDRSAVARINEARMPYVVVRDFKGDVVGTADKAFFSDTPNFKG